MSEKEKIQIMTPPPPAALAAAEEIVQLLDECADVPSFKAGVAEIIARHTSAPASDGEVEACAAVELKARAALSPGGEREGDGWRPIETAPKDGTAILAVIGLYRRDQSFSHWDLHIIAFDQDRGAISPDHDQGWDWEDYEGWQPLPAPPLAPQEAGR